MKLINVRGEDFAALYFEEVYKDMKVLDFINRHFNQSNKIELELIDKCMSTVELLEFKNIDLNFIKFIKDKYIDYDQSKHSNFYLENEII